MRGDVLPCGALILSILFILSKDRGRAERFREGEAPAGGRGSCRAAAPARSAGRKGGTSSEQGSTRDEQGGTREEGEEEGRGERSEVPLGGRTACSTLDRQSRGKRAISDAGSRLA